METDVETEVGILFIHGIGARRRGDTLVNCSEPLREWIDGWLKGSAFGAWRTAGVTLSEFQKILGSAEASDLGPIPKARLIESLFVAFGNHNWLEMGPMVLPPETIVAGSCDFGSVFLKPTDGSPANGILEIRALRANGQVKEFKIRVAEAFWGDAFEAPPYWEFVAWAVKHLPLALRRHCGWALYQAFHQESVASRLIDGAVWVVLSLLSLLLPIPIVALLILAWPLQYLPVPGARQFASAVVQVVSGILGDSYAFLDRPAYFSAIRTAAEGSLDWIHKRSGKLIVVAHSQGAAVAFEVLVSRQYPKVVQLITLGSGIRKLLELRSRLFVDDLRVGAWIGVGIAALALPLLIDLARGMPPRLSIGLTGLAFMFLMIVFDRVWIAASDEIGNSRAVGRESKAWRLEWNALNATHDPVCNGNHFSRARTPTSLLEEEVHNGGSVLTDHTAYWRNSLQVVMRVAAHVGAHAGFPFTSPLGNDREVLANGYHLQKFWISLVRVSWACFCFSFLHWMLSGGASLKWIESGLYKIARAVHTLESLVGAGSIPTTHAINSIADWIAASRWTSTVGVLIYWFASWSLFRALSRLVLSAAVRSIWRRSPQIPKSMIALAGAAIVILPLLVNEAAPIQGVDVWIAVPLALLYWKDARRAFEVLVDSSLKLAKL